MSEISANEAARSFADLRDAVEHRGERGGTKWAFWTGLNGWCQSNYWLRPAEIRASKYGRYAELLPGGAHHTYTTGEWAVAQAVSVEIGVATQGVAAAGRWESSEKQKRLDKVDQVHEVATDGQLPPLGSVFRYDMDWSGRWDHWSCELRPGYTGGWPCWEIGK